MRCSKQLSQSKDKFVVLPSDIFNPILLNDLYDSSVSFTVYLLNPRISTQIKYSYAATNTSSCHTSLLVCYSEGLQYMLIDISSSSSSYGSFIPTVGFQMISYPKLLLKMENKQVMNPSFIPEIAQVLHQAISMYLYPDINYGLFSVISENPKSVVEDGPSWDFGVIHIEIVTIVEEVKGNNFEIFLTQNERESRLYWRTVAKQLQHMSLSKKQISISNQFFPLSKVPNFSLILSESYELLSTNHTFQRNNVYTQIRSDVVLSLLKEHKTEIWREFGFDLLERDLTKTTVGTVTIIPVFM